MKKVNPNLIELDQPAHAWQQGTLLGNGFMGQVIYGQPCREIVELSELTFFSGAASGNRYREGAKEAFAQMRCGGVREDFKMLKDMTGSFMGIRGNYGTNLPVGRLHLNFDYPEAGEMDVHKYSRVLDLDRGIAGISFENGTGRCCREAFSSHRDRVFAYLLEDDSREGMNLSVSFDGGRNSFHTFQREGAFGFTVQARESLHSDGQCGTELEGLIVPEADGNTAVTEQGIRILGAHRIVLYLGMETDFESCGRNVHEILKDGKSREGNGLAGRLRDCYLQYPRLKERHIQDIAELMGRQSLSLGGENRKTEVMYQYGRYLLLSSSREDSPLPAHLQGVWNDDVACCLGWTCDMHLDINTQMNYWLSEPGNLSECHLPLFRWMEERLIPQGRLNAEICYGLSGWAAELVSNAWGYAAPYWNPALAPCPTGGIWQASDYIEHYRYTQDMEFLRKKALPVLREAVKFFLEYLFEDDLGYLTSGPSISPENAFLADGERYYASNGCTYEILMIRELLEQYRELIKELEETEMPEGTREPDKMEARKGTKEDIALAVLAGKACSRLLPYRILPDGTLAEWSHNYPAADSQHRHTSHLLGLFPYSQITLEDTPLLAQAAARSIEAKLTPQENWEDTGWARSLLALYSARLKKGEEAWQHIKYMEEKLSGSNLLVFHPPTRGTDTGREVYELDGNTGFSMAVMEMLLQSHNGVIQLLPALPKAWKNGCLKGGAARGGIRLDMEWEKGRPVMVEASADRNCKGVISFAGKRISFQLEAGKNTRLDLTGM